MVAEQAQDHRYYSQCCSLAKISMVAEPIPLGNTIFSSCSLAKISMVAEHPLLLLLFPQGCSLAKISMVAELIFQTSF